MNPFLIILLVLVTVFVLFQVWMIIKSKRSVGKKIPIDTIDVDVAKQIDGKRGMLYFYSDRCNNCKTQSPIINKIRENNKNIISVDASQNIETARSLNVMGTPSIIFFSGNKITGYYVGVKSESFILNKLKTI